MTNSQARTRLLRQIDKLLIRSGCESRPRNCQEECPDETNRSDAMLLYSYDRFLLWVVKVAFALFLFLICLALILVCLPTSSFAQPVPLPLPQLDQLVARIALYPDPLLAQILTASTYWTEIPEAATWADQHSYLKGDALAQAIQADHLQWEPSVLALLPFPSVLDMMAHDLSWTQQLGNAVLTQRPAVMDAVQRMRQRARHYGYLAPNGYVNVVSDGGYIQILPVNPNVLMCPITILWSSMSHRCRALLLQTLSTSVLESRLGQSSVDGDGGSVRDSYGLHTILIDRRPWTRVWVNRFGYVHPYAHPWVRPIGPRMGVHRLRR